MNDFYTALSDRLQGCEVLREEPMSQHTTFRTGGSAQFYVSVDSVSALQEGIACCREHTVPVYVLGNGSNVLVSDKGIDGVVFQLGAAFSHISVAPEGDGRERVCVQAGAKLSAVGARVAEEGLTGFEWAAGIPGTVGGAVYMNAGAYGGEIKDVLKEATVLTQSLSIETWSLKRLELEYRSSALMRAGAYVLEAVFVLRHGNTQQITERMRELAARRREKQPLEYPSAGSTFKRPEGYYAGKLIQDAGLRGYQVGGAQVSEKHCGFVINRGDATAQDIYQLTEDVRRIVQEQTGVLLEREIRLLGEFPC